MNGCPYCATDGERKPIPGWGGGELEMVQITPMPAINLTSGERDTSVETPFWAMNFVAFEVLLLTRKMFRSLLLRMSLRSLFPSTTARCAGESFRNGHCPVAKLTDIK